jgi:hypothetical protein
VDSGLVRYFVQISREMTRLCGVVAITSDFGAKRAPVADQTTILDH